MPFSKLSSSAHAFSRRDVYVRLSWASRQRGFTLIEMLAVVILITTLAAIAIPLATKQMRDRRTQDAAQQVATLYQSARMRAMGRGSAVLVRYTPGTPGQFELLEAQRGPTASADGSVDTACAALPVSSCLTTNWTTPAAQQYRSISTLSFSSGLYEQLTVTMNEGNALDICFTPMGRAYVASTGQRLSPLTQVYTVDVDRSAALRTRAREVLVLPNGAARLAL